MSKLKWFTVVGTILRGDLLPYCKDFCTKRSDRKYKCSLGNKNLLALSVHGLLAWSALGFNVANASEPETRSSEKQKTYQECPQEFDAIVMEESGCLKSDWTKMLYLKKRLEQKGFKASRYQLEPFVLLLHESQRYQKSSVACYKLLDLSYHQAKDTVFRGRQSVALIQNDLLIGPSPKLFSRLLHAVGYFQDPQSFTEQEIFQLHNFALDDFKGYEVRETSLEHGRDFLMVHGTTYTGKYPHDLIKVPFSTRVVRGKGATFKVEEPKPSDVLEMSP